MSMEVKRDEALTPDARQYLADRNQHELIAAIDDAYPPAEDPQLANMSPDWMPATGLELLSDEELQAELDRRKAAVASVEYEEDDVPYEEWTKAELDEELGRRTDADGKPLSTSGTNVQKAKRLREHDAQSPKPL